jgi:hypothetical protein
VQHTPWLQTKVRKVVCMWFESETHWKREQREQRKGQSKQCSAFVEGFCVKVVGPQSKDANWAVAIDIAYLYTYASQSHNQPTEPFWWPQEVKAQGRVALFGWHGLEARGLIYSL